MVEICFTFESFQKQLNKDVNLLSTAVASRNYATDRKSKKTPKKPKQRSITPTKKSTQYSFLTSLNKASTGKTPLGTPFVGGNLNNDHAKSTILNNGMIFDRFKNHHKSIRLNEEQREMFRDGGRGGGPDVFQCSPKHERQDTKGIIDAGKEDVRIYSGPTASKKRVNSNQMKSVTMRSELDAISGLFKEKPLLKGKRGFEDTMENIEEEYIRNREKEIARKSWMPKEWLKTLEMEKQIASLADKRALQREKHHGSSVDVLPDEQVVNGLGTPNDIPLKAATNTSPSLSYDSPNQEPALHAMPLDLVNKTIPPTSSSLSKKESKQIRDNNIRTPSPRAVINETIPLSSVKQERWIGEFQRRSAESTCSQKQGKCVEGAVEMKPKSPDNHLGYIFPKEAAKSQTLIKGSTLSDKKPTKIHPHESNTTTASLENNVPAKSFREILKEQPPNKRQKAVISLKPYDTNAGDSANSSNGKAIITDSTTPILLPAPKVEVEHLPFGMPKNKSISLSYRRDKLKNSAVQTPSTAQPCSSDILIKSSLNSIIKSKGKQVSGNKTIAKVLPNIIEKSQPKRQQSALKPVLNNSSTLVKNEKRKKLTKAMNKPKPRKVNSQPDLSQKDSANLLEPKTEIRIVNNQSKFYQDLSEQLKIPKSDLNKASKKKMSGSKSLLSALDLAQVARGNGCKKSEKTNEKGNTFALNEMPDKLKKESLAYNIMSDLPKEMRNSLDGMASMRAKPVDMSAVTKSKQGKQIDKENRNWQVYEKKKPLDKKISKYMCTLVKYYCTKL